MLSAVASRDADRANAFAREHGIPRAYGSYEDLIDDPDIDALYIPLPNSLHRDWVIHAVRAGKHVLCEKPLALNAADCFEMAAAAEEAEGSAGATRRSAKRASEATSPTEGRRRWRAEGNSA